MRLTTLEIKGFKSFGDKVTIHFDRGVTSIVGPNGSGKSNVVDAMRWVLGEQKTRMLRSEKMENVIFNGTKSRKPSNMAEVSLSFENTKNILPTEYANVTISRRLYRSGESEYLLNNVPCRLKDITDLFLDTGIGSDSYAIIELKMVDEILSDKNNAIKNLLEEAAGISKYKIRKKQTLQKLEDTDSDLNRVNDLLFEIERNMKSFESQAKKTERYYRLKEQYKENSSELALFQIAGSRKTFDELQSREEKQQEEKIALDATLDKTEAEVQSLKLHALDKEKELSESQKLFNEKINFIRQQENEKKVSNEKLKYLQDKESNLSNGLSQDKLKLLSTQELLSTIVSSQYEAEVVLEQLQVQLQEKKEELDSTRLKHDQMKSDINRLSGEAQSVQLAMHESEKSLAVTQAKKDSLQKETERLSADSVLKQHEHDELQHHAESTNRIREEKEHQLQALLSAEEQVGHEIIRLDEELKKVTEELIAEGRKLDARQNEFNLNKSLLENLEGYPESLRFLRKNGSSASHAPLLSEILNCPLEFKSAIEHYLDPYMNYFLIGNIDEASRAVNLLSEAAKGRANFFILKNFEGSPAPAEESIPGCIPAMQIIDVEDSFRPLCNHLLKNVYVVIENQDQTPFLQQENGTKTFISKNGKFCRTRHSLSGGSVGMLDGKRIGRAKHMETLTREIEELSRTLDELKIRRDRMQEDLQQNKRNKEQFTAEKNQIQQETSKVAYEYSSLRNKADHLNSSIENNRKILHALQEQLSGIDETLLQNNLNFHEHLEQLRTQYETTIGALNSLQLEFNALTEVMNAQSQAFNQHHIQCIQQQNQITTISRDHALNTNLIETLNTNIGTNAREMEMVQIQIRELLENTSGFDSQLQDLYLEKEIVEKQVSAIEGEYFKARGAIDEMESTLRQIRHQREQADQLAQAIRDKTTELRIQLNSLKERLSVEFNIDINDFLEREPSAEWTEEELREKVGKMKSQLDNYGPINPMAVEAFNEIKDRFTFITVQKEDLAKAKESLLKTIEEIEITAKENFMKAFTDIRKNFIMVFRSLFTEDDDCDLVLMNPENPTESDVQIVAKPKGKRPLSISQLSGGEKTLTATALLFGIYLLKPAPFCIFDEVDAPLDDNNIDKFNNIIRKFSADSQFIIITHNKRTMSSTDIMYGITMIEQGVTQVVPVDLAEMAE